MPRATATEEAYERLGLMAERPLTEADVVELRELFRRGPAILVERAARAVAVHHRADFVAAMSAAFPRFLKDPIKSDKGCRAKTAIVRALNELECTERDVFHAGRTHIQKEPSFGPPVDMADHLRAECLNGLYRCGEPDIFLYVVDGLADTEPVPCRAAIKILGALGGDTAEALLRLKILQGDERGEVMAEAFGAILAAAPQRSLPFVAGYMNKGSSELAEDAALAIGNSRHRDAFPTLLHAWEESIDPPFKLRLLVPMALSRSEAAFDFLLDVVRDEHADYAAAALTGLELYGKEAATMAAIRAAVSARGDSGMTRDFEARLNSKPA